MSIDAADALLFGASVLVIGLAIFDISIWWEFHQAARRPPPPTGTFYLAIAARRATAVTASIFAILGANQIVFIVTDGAFRILPTPTPTLLVVVGAIVVSLPSFTARRVLAELEAEARDLHLHQREGDASVHPHRRADDAPIPVDEAGR